MKNNRPILFCLILVLALSGMACELANVWTEAKATAVAETQPATAVPAADDSIVQSSTVEEIFTITSVGVASNGASVPTVFTLDESWLVTEIKTYHWNNGRGVPPGTIGLEAADGTTYGPWQAIGLPGQGGVENAYWVVTPQVTIPAGSYTVVDSDPSTWAKNDADTGGMGMTWGVGIRMGNP